MAWVGPARDLAERRQTKGCLLPFVVLACGARQLQAELAQVIVLYSYAACIGNKLHAPVAEGLATVPREDQETFDSKGSVGPETAVAAMLAVAIGGAVSRLRLALTASRRASRAWKHAA